MTLTYSIKTGLLLGGSCELALGTAEMMIQTGLFPVLTYRSSKGMQKILKGLAQYEGRYTVHECDLKKRDTICMLFSKMGNGLDFLVDFSHGRLENLVASADTEMVDMYFMENIAARAEVIKTASRLMLKRKKGRFVYISSTAAETPNPGQGFYAAAKLASEVLYRNTGLELASRGIKSMILRPGYIDSGRGRQYLAEKKETYMDKINRYGVLSCRQMVEVILYLLSDNVEKHNAAIFEVDGVNGLRSAYGDVIKYKNSDCGDS